MVNKKGDTKLPMTDYGTNQSGTNQSRKVINTIVFTLNRIHQCKKVSMEMVEALSYDMKYLYCLTVCPSNFRICSTLNQKKALFSFV